VSGFPYGAVAFWPLGLFALLRFFSFFLCHFQDTLKRARNTVNPDAHCQCLRWGRNMYVTYPMTSIP
jgi:hypothetical protein